MFIRRLFVIIPIIILLCLSVSARHFSAIAVGIMTQALKTNTKGKGNWDGFWLSNGDLPMLSRRVYTIERVRELSLYAQAVFQQLMS